MTVSQNSITNETKLSQNSKTVECVHFGTSKLVFRFALMPQYIYNKERKDRTCRTGQAKLFFPLYVLFRISFFLYIIRHKSYEYNTNISVLGYYFTAYIFGSKEKEHWHSFRAQPIIFPFLAIFSPYNVPKWRDDREKKKQFYRPQAPTTDNYVLQVLRGICALHQRYVLLL
jgi:hypothetical protein